MKFLSNDSDRRKSCQGNMFFYHASGNTIKINKLSFQAISQKATIIAGKKGMTCWDKYPGTRDEESDLFLPSPKSQIPNICNK